MATWAKNTAQVRDNGFGGSRGGRSIEGAVFHHVAGTNGLDYVANANSRNSHPTYHVANSGRVTGVVHPDRRPFSTAHSVDNVAITFEIDNSSTGGNWPVSDAALSAAIDTCVDHARQAGLKKFAKNTPGKDQPGVFFIAWHSQYQATACPGQHILSKIDWIIAECQRRLDGGKPAPAPKPQPGGKTVDQLVTEVMAGLHGNGDARRKSLGSQYAKVQAEINRRYYPGTQKPAPKSISDLAEEVLAGKHGNGDARRRSLGAQYSAVQAEVNRRLNVGSGKSVGQLAAEVIRGDWGNGADRRRRLTAAGHNYSAVQAEVNRQIGI